VGAGALRFYREISEGSALTLHGVRLYTTPVLRLGLCPPVPRLSRGGRSSESAMLSVLPLPPTHSGIISQVFTLGSMRVVDVGASRGILVGYSRTPRNEDAPLSAGRSRFGPHLWIARGTSTDAPTAIFARHFCRSFPYRFFRVKSSRGFPAIRMRPRRGRVYE